MFRSIPSNTQCALFADTYHLTLVHALVVTKVDYYSSVLSGIFEQLSRAYNGCSFFVHPRLPRHAVGSQKVSLSCLFDLSAAFDTIDHDIFITRLSSWFDIHGSVLSWFKSYLSSRCFRVKSETDLSSWYTSSCGVPKALSLVHYSSSCTPLL